MNCKYGFKIARKGYDPAEVDAYIDEQLARMTAMQEQNTALMNKLSEAQDMIRHYSATEKALRKSIAESKRGAADLLSDARERSTNLVDTAREECNRIVDELDAKIDERYKTLDEIKNNVLRFKQELFQLYSDHIEMVEVLSNTAENFKYEPDFTALSEAIDAFEESAAAVETPEVPTFPQCPEDGFFEVAPDKSELEAAEALAETPVVTEALAEEPEIQNVIEIAPSEMDFGFEEADMAVEMEAVTPDDDAVTGNEFEDMFFAVDKEPDADAEENIPDFEEIVAPTEAEEAEIDEDDDMFFKSKEDVKEKEELFNFLKDFVNGSEE